METVKKTWRYFGRESFALINQHAQCGEVLSLNTGSGCEVIDVSAEKKTNARNQLKTNFFLRWNRHRADDYYLCISLIRKLSAQ